jgi:hypothetical protein
MAKLPAFVICIQTIESIQRVLKRRALGGQYPHSIRETIIRYGDLAAKRRTESK